MNGDQHDHGPCMRCGHSVTESPEWDDFGGIDPCLGPGLMPGVSAACCGHGVVEPYVRLGGESGVLRDEIENQVTLYGPAAMQFFALVKAARAGDRGEFWS